LQVLWINLYPAHSEWPINFLVILHFFIQFAHFRASSTGLGLNIFCFAFYIALRILLIELDHSQWKQTLGTQERLEHLYSFELKHIYRLTYISDLLFFDAGNQQSGNRSTRKRVRCSLFSGEGYSTTYSTGISSNHDIQRYDI